MSWNEDIVLTMSAYDESDGIGTTQGALGAFMRDKMRDARFPYRDLSQTAEVLPLVVAFGLLGGRVPRDLVATNAEKTVLSVGSVTCHAHWRDCQDVAHVSAGGRLVIGIPRSYAPGAYGSTFQVPHPSANTKRRIVAFSRWAVGLLAPHHHQAWLVASLNGDPVAGAAVAMLAHPGGVAAATNMVAP